MKTKILIASLFFLVIYGCSKNDSSKPGLSLKSLNATTFNPGETIAFSFNFTAPKGGKVTDTLFIIRNFISCPFKKRDSTNFIVPEFTATSNQKAVLDYSYIYSPGQSVYGGCNNGNSIYKTDSIYFSFYLKDKDGNTSDTIKAPKITLIYK